MSGATRVRAFAPATVGNVICGFDVFGLALEAPGDEVVAWPADQPGVEIRTITGDDGRLPTEPGRNAASVAAQAVLDQVRCAHGLTLEIHKGLPLASGMGGSAASSVAGAVAAAAAVGVELDRPTLLACALQGERAAVGSAHADNAAPCLYGGLTLTLPGQPVEVVELPLPAGLAVALVPPPLELETAAGRRALGTSVSLDAGVAQWAATAALVAGLYREDLSLISRALVDHVAEPVRKAGVPGFDDVRAAALAVGALGAGLSGSGPSVFALCPSVEVAQRAGGVMAAALEEAGVRGSDVFAGPVGRSGARILEEAPARGSDTP